jgi:hypothetical protein
MYGSGEERVQKTPAGELRTAPPPAPLAYGVVLIGIFGFLEQAYFGTKLHNRILNLVHTLPNKTMSLK